MGRRRKYSDECESYKKHRRIIVRRSMEKRRARFKAEGLCIQCGRRPPKPFRTLCEICLTKQVAASKRYLAKKKATEVSADGDGAQ